LAIENINGLQGRQRLWPHPLDTGGLAAKLTI